MGLFSVTQLARDPDDLLIVVPARVSSGRFPAKALAEIAGTSVIRNVVDRVREATRARLVVATDSDLIARQVDGVCEVAMVDGPGLACGTDRIAAAVVALNVAPRWVVNVQGDEVCLPALALGTLLAALPSANAPMVTAVVPMDRREGLGCVDVVKATLDGRGRAADFSRGPAAESPGPWYRHVGLYAYTSDALRDFAAMPPSRRERAESLEQLRAIEAGWPIDVVVLEDYRDRPWPSINRPEDVEAAERYLDIERKGAHVAGGGRAVNSNDGQAPISAAKAPARSA